MTNHNELRQRVSKPDAVHVYQGRGHRKPDHGTRGHNMRPRDGEYDPELDTGWSRGLTNRKLGAIGTGELHPLIAERYDDSEHGSVIYVADTPRDTSTLPAKELTFEEREAEIKRLEEEQRSDDKDYCDSTSTGPDDLSAELLAEERAYNREHLRNVHTRDYEGRVPFNRTDDTSTDKPNHPFCGKGMHIIKP